MRRFQSMPIVLRATLVTALALAAGVPAWSSEGPDLFERPDAFAAALRDRFGDGVRVLRVGIDADGADADVQDPRIPANVDRYAFEEGVLGAPQPVQVGRNQRKLEARLFLFSEVDLSVLPRLLVDAVRRADTPEGRVSQVTIERAEGYGEYESWGRPTVRAVVQGPRGGAVVEYRLDGKHARTIRW
jgi:hypothetical protein